MIISKINLKLFLKQIKNKKKKSAFLNHCVNNSIIYLKDLPKLKENKISLYQKINCPILYIITIKYTKVNTLLSVTNSKGLLYLFVSAGQCVKGKKKISRIIVIKKFLKILISDLDFLKNKPIALHLKNVDFNRMWLIKFLKKKFFIKTIKNFNIFPHNGCRKKKKKRKKVRSFAKKTKF